jgi:hypothetical protein
MKMKAASMAIEMAKISQSNGMAAHRKLSAANENWLSI